MIITGREKVKYDEEGRDPPMIGKDDEDEDEDDEWTASASASAGMGSMGEYWRPIREREERRNQLRMEKEREGLEREERKKVRLKRHIKGFSYLKISPFLFLFSFPVLTSKVLPSR